MTPEVIDCFEQDEYQLLLLEYFEEVRPDRSFWEKFGRVLSGLHRNGQTQFGLDHNNYIGTLHQHNEYKSSWEDFFYLKRIKPLMKRAYDRGLLRDKHIRMFEGLFKSFSELIPVEPPALLHGDLWSGNLLCASGQRPVFIDPAVYYGHREMDIAMTRMFGGFDNAYLDEYNNVYPLEKEWQKRLSIHNLYPNLVHLNLFGISYLGNIESVIKRFK